MTANATPSTPLRPAVRRTLGQAGVILLVSLVAAALTWWLHPRRPAWYQVEDALTAQYQLTVDELRELYSPDQILWIDSRLPAQFDEGHLPGAYRLTSENWADGLWDLRAEIESLEGRAVVVYCDGRRCKRSGEIAERLRTEVGLEPVWILKGDWRDW